jgi:hypothetical protein
LYQGVVEIRSRGIESEASSNDRRESLEFLKGYIDAFVAKLLESSFQPFSTEKLFDIVDGASRALEKQPIRTARIVVDAML